MGIFFRISVFAAAVLACHSAASAGKGFPRDFSPAEGIVAPVERGFRDEICLNGLWDFQGADIPRGWKPGSGIPPELPAARPDGWDAVKIKIPSPWNVNSWGGGQKTGEGTSRPYAPSSVYFPGYPEGWASKRMGWLRRDFSLPASWAGRRVIIRFDAVAGESALYVNGKFIASNMTQHTGFSADITGALKPGKNEVLLGVRHIKLFDMEPPPAGEGTKYFPGMRGMFPGGSNTDDLAGIWQDVFLEAVPETHVADVFAKPMVGRGELELEIEVANASEEPFEGEVSADVREWINKNPALAASAGLSLDDGKPLGERLGAVLDAPEISWSLARKPAMELPARKISLKPGETAKVSLKAEVSGRLKHWTPDAPNLYGAVVSLSSRGRAADAKYARFGWREFGISGSDFTLNGEKIQARGDIQHPFGPYVCSRRFAYAWYLMIKSFGGNAVRPHAQVWPKCYYDLADEMGIMVLCENGFFGSSLRPNLARGELWERAAGQTRRMVLRHRNNPSVMGWSVGNEMFALSLPHLAKIPAGEKAEWNRKLAGLAALARSLDPTRPFVTVDGDGDLEGALPVWSRHLGDGFDAGRIAKIRESMGSQKPIVIGEFGATYYGMPPRVWKYAGDRAFESYAGRNEALATDLYKNVSEMAVPHAAYFSPSEVCWFGIEHLNYGYSDFSRLPGPGDGVFPAKAYEEGRPGWQFERIPPYVSTLNPGIDPKLPFMRPMAMYTALKAAFAGMPCPWDSYSVLPGAVEELPFARPAPSPSGEPAFAGARFVGDRGGRLAKRLEKLGIALEGPDGRSGFAIVDGENAGKAEAETLARKIIPELSRVPGAAVLVMTADGGPSPALEPVFGGKIGVFEGVSTSLEKGEDARVAGAFNVPDLYFVRGGRGDREIAKISFDAGGIGGAVSALRAARTNWDLFDAPENVKCAQMVLYGHLEKRRGDVLFSKPMGRGRLYLSSLNYNLESGDAEGFFRALFRALGLASSGAGASDAPGKVHDLLRDGPID